MLALLLALQGVVSPQADSLPRITLREALQRAARLDPEYVQALGQVNNAAWGRRAAFAVFILPSVTLSTDATRYSPPFFNFGTLQPEPYSVQAAVTLRYDLFTGGQKLAELTRTAAALDGARAGELAARFASALLTESNYYDVLAGQELTRVARDRVRRGQEQLTVARARVVSGAAVQTDSLNLRLELTRARVALLEQQSALRVARLQLGRRVGAPGP
ncbi:MAG: TolC family protein, partial [Gemmatimonadales bacterium]